VLGENPAVRRELAASWRRDGPTRRAGRPGARHRAATEVIGAERAGTFIRSYAERHHLLVAEEDGEVAGVLAFRTDWFQCTFVGSSAWTRTSAGAASRGRSTGWSRRSRRAPRLFSSTEETNAGLDPDAHRARLAPSGYIDNLPQGYRELLFYKRLRPSSAG